MIEILQEPSWLQALAEELDKDYIQQLNQKIENEYTIHTIYPQYRDIFRAFELCPIDKVKVVILGQDPYHNPDQAMGMSFSVPSTTTIPPSLKNIFQEITSDIGITPIHNGYLSRWVHQGVFLLNSILTVKAGDPGSHQKYGWEQFTDKVIKLVSQHHPHIVFMLWGTYAQSKEPLIDSSCHLILKTSHPSPLSAYRGFIGCRHFSQANTYLKNHTIEPINWI